MNLPTDNVESTVLKVKNIFLMEHGWQGRALKITPWIIALTFWGYNTTTCVFHNYLNGEIYPYKAKKVVVLHNENIAPTELLSGTEFPVTHEFNDKVKLPKWDCDLEAAPLSTITTRIWTLLYYGLPPFLLARLIAIIWGVSSFRQTIKRLESNTVNANGKPFRALIIKLFGEDGFGGLNYIADAGMSYLYVIVGFIFLLTMSFFKEGPDPSWHNYILIFIFIPIAFMSFRAPTATNKNLHLRFIKRKYR